MTNTPIPKKSSLALLNINGRLKIKKIKIVISILKAKEEKYIGS
jgi:hypothetical protein